MSRTPDQSMTCLRRDLDWLARIRKRARDNETRSEKKHTRVLVCLKEVMEIFQDELDADSKSVPRKESRAQARAERAARMKAAQLELDLANEGAKAGANGSGNGAGE